MSRNEATQGASPLRLVSAGRRAYAAAVSSPLVAPLLLAAAALVYCYWDVFAVLLYQWTSNDAFSHGFLIPIISAYFVWQSRGRLAALSWVGATPSGLAALTGGLAILLLGRSLDIVGIQELSLLPSLAGLVLVAGGYRALRVLWFPIAYLIFMMPVWDVLTERMHYPFQRLSARLGAHLLEAAGIPVLHHETFLQLPNVTLEVARVCSGVNYLVAVAAIGVPLAYLVFRDWPRRVLLVGIGLTIAVLANPVRVALIGIFSYFGLSADVHGPGHVFQGLFVAAMGYGALLCGVAVLSRWPRAARSGASKPVRRAVGLRGSGSGRPGAEALANAEQAAAPLEPRTSNLEPRQGRLRYGLLAAVVLLLGASAIRPAALAHDSDPSLSADLPASIGSWQRIERAAFTRTPADGSLVYRNGSGQQVELRFAPVIPDYDAPSPDTWVDAVALQATPFALSLAEGARVTVNLAKGAGGIEPTPVLYWYDIDGQVSSNRITAKVHAMWHRLTRRGRRPVTVFVRAVASGVTGEEELLQATAAFSSDLIALLGRSLGLQSGAGDADASGAATPVLSSDL